MTVRRDGDGIVLEDACPVDECEALLQQVQAGADFIEWSGCTHLHAACLQVMFASGLPLRGTPANPALGRWVGPMVARQCKSEFQETVV
jgi:hypothetical protein